MSTPPVSLRLDDVHVSYSVYTDHPGGLKNFVSGQRRRAQKIRAVRGVSFEVYEGQSLGIVGSNGSGKSTLLSAMTGLLPLASGEIWVRSRPTLLGVGSVMRPGLSGRRNIVVGGLALGLTLEEIRRRVPDIIEFSGLEESIDRPMRTYSSGMRARLMFAIATSSTPDILLIDEALAVGDSDFLHKSQRRIDEIRRAAGAVVLVSHNLSEIRESCDRVAWLDRGVLRAIGDPDDVIAEYEESVLGIRRMADDATQRRNEAIIEPLRDPGPGRPPSTAARSDRRVTLHIGSTHTALPIQRYLGADEERLQEAGVSVPSYLRTLSHYHFAAYASPLAAAQLPVRISDDWEHWSDDFAAAFVSRTNDGRDWIISSEALVSRVGAPGLERLRVLFERAGFVEVRAVIYLQRQDRLAARTYIESLFAGHTTAFDIEEHLQADERYDYRRLLERWGASDLIDHLDVRLFPDRDGMPDLVEDFANLLGLPCPTPVEYREEKRLAVEDTDFVRHLNELVPQRDADGNHIDGAAAAAPLLARHAVEREFMLTRDESDRLMERYAAVNAWVIEQVAPDVRIDDYFAAGADLPATRPRLTLEHSLELAGQLLRRTGR